MTCAAPLAAVVPASESRKVVSIVFMDVVGSTDLGDRLDPEAVRALMARYFDVSREILQSHGGTVEKFIGDAVMAVFGIPRVAEDDALRAVSAAVGLRDSLAALDRETLERHGAGFGVRIGVNTGEVVAGDASSGQAFVAGDTVNVAARFEQAAGRNEILIGEATYRLVRDDVVAEPVEPLTLKGKPDPVPAFRVERIAEADVGRPVATSFVGREADIAALNEMLDDVIGARSGRLVVVTGDAGIGKTRLIAEFLRRRAGECTWLAGRCAPSGEAAAVRPLAEIVLQAAGSSWDASDEDLLARIAALLPGEERAPLIADGVLRAIGRGEPGGSAQEALASLRTLLYSLGARRPLAIFVDDVHWAAEGTLGFIEDLANGASGVPLLVLCGARPDLRRDWRVERETALLLEPLGAGSCDAMFGQLSGGALGEEVRRRLAGAADGNPLFIEETVRMLVDEGTIRRTEEGWLLEADVETLQTPQSIRAILAARLDSLPPAERLVCECAAVCGREFEVTDVAALAPNIAVSEALDGLTARQIVHPAGGDRHRFHHALMQEVAYETMTKGRRSELHLALARQLEAAGEPEPGVMGHHLERSFGFGMDLGEPDPSIALEAAGWLARSASASIARGDRTAAADGLGRCVELLVAGEADGAPAAPLRAAVAHGLAGLGEWERAVALLDPVAEQAGPGAMKDLGVSLTKFHRDDATGEEYRRGQALLERAAEAGDDPDAFASLAGTFKGVDDARVHALYLRALALDPSYPYALGNHVEYELRERGDLDVLDQFHDAIEGAAGRCRQQADAGENLPWAFFDLGKFRLLSGDPYFALDSYAKAVHLSTAAFMIETSLRSLEGLSVADELQGMAWMRRLLLLGLAGPFDDADARARVREAATGGAPAIQAPVLVLAGSSESDADEAFAAVHDGLASTVTGGTIVSGGTRQGVGALAGTLAEATRARVVGYVPAVFSAGVELDDRYTELRRTDGTDFGASEPLQYWADIIAAGIAPEEVRLVGIGGGNIAAAEYRIALGLGAQVSIVRGSGREADELLRDRDWATSDRLTELAGNA